MNTTPQPEERVKVWRPQGFAGLEVEKLGLFEMDIPKMIVPAFDLTVIAECRGRGVSNIDGTSYPVRDFDEPRLYTSNAGVKWYAEAEREHFVDAWTLRFSEACMTHFITELTETPTLPYFPSYEVDEEVNAPLTKLAQDAINSFDQPASTLEREGKLMGLLHATLKYCSTSVNLEKSLGKEPSAVTLVRDALHSAPEMDIKLDDLASLTGLNKFYLGRVFSKEVGISPHQYQLGLRVQRAKDKLASGETLANITLDTGFSDQAHFTRVFKKFTLTTPGRFQRDTLSS